MMDRPRGFAQAVRWLDTPDGRLRIYSLRHLDEAGLADTQRLPYAIRILLENLLRYYDGDVVRWDDIVALARWSPQTVPSVEIPFRPERVLLQDFAGVPCVADLAAMRAAVKRLGGDPRRVNPVVPVDLVIDHSVQVDFFGTVDAFEQNVAMEYERNRERYAFLRWAQRAFLGRALSIRSTSSTWHRSSRSGRPRTASSRLFPTRSSGRTPIRR
jgi:aconitate hydratase